MLTHASRRTRADASRLLPAAVACCLQIVLHASPAVAETPRSLDPIAADFYFNADPGLDLEAVRAPDLEGRFTPAGDRTLWVGREAPVAWLRFALEPRASGGDSARIVEVRPSFSIIMDRVDLYIPLRDGGYRRLAAGALMPSQEGELRSRSFLFELPPDAREGGLCYLRVESDTDVEFHASVRSEAELSREGQLESLAYGIVFGVLIAMALYNLFLYASLGYVTYFYYVLYIAMGIAWLFLVQGWSRAVFGSHPGLDQSLLWLFAGLMLACGGLFTLSFLKLRGNNPVLFIAMSALACASVAAALAGALGLQRLAFVATNYLGAAMCFLIVFSAARRLIQGYAPARYFLVGWGTLVLSGALFILMDLKVLPVNFLTVNSTAIGMTAESILLSMALADRIRRLELDRFRLERNQERLREASLTDELTGLYNRRFLFQELESATARASAEGRRLSAILLDIDDFKRINDSWGHSFGDEVLSSLGAVIRSSIRDRDSPCRYGGEEFVVVMPDISLEDAASAAERIRARFSAQVMEPRAGERVRAAVSLGVVELEKGESPQRFIDRADGAMYEAKRLGKNRVVALGPAAGVWRRE
jgi:diguanylate cyclase (GGDEF)-like protein